MPTHDKQQWVTPHRLLAVLTQISRWATNDLVFCLSKDLVMLTSLDGTEVVARVDLECTCDWHLLLAIEELTKAELETQGDANDSIRHLSRGMSQAERAIIERTIAAFEHACSQGMTPNLRGL